MQSEPTPLKPQPFSSNSTTYSPKSQFRYSSSTTQAYKQGPTSSQRTRRYATPEESDAVQPVFTTPTDMYLKRELNPQQRYAVPQQQQQQQTYKGYPAQPSYSSQRTQQYAGSSFDPLSSKPRPAAPSSPVSGASSFQYHREDERPNLGNNMGSTSSVKQPSENGTFASASSNTSTSSAKDMLLAQLIDMGFSLEAAKVAIAASGGTNLQDALDILVQNEQAKENMRPNNDRSPSDEDMSQANRRAEEELWNRQQEERRREYLEQLKRNKPTPPKPKFSSSANYSNPNHASPYASPQQQYASPQMPSQQPQYASPQMPPQQPVPPQVPPHSPPPKTTPVPDINTAPPPPQVDPAVAYADKERKEGNYYFNKGQFVNSENAYTLAIRSLPDDHGDLVLLCNNRAAARLKRAKFNECLVDCSFAVDIANRHMQRNAPISPIMKATNTNMKAQLIKALHRKACALEGLHQYEAAIQVYEEYVRLDGSRSAQVTQGIMRCQQAILESKKQSQWQPPKPTGDGATAFPDIDFNMFIPKSTKESQAKQDEINNSKAVKEMRDREKKKEAEDAERLEKEDKVNAQISVWKTGKDRNLRALLGSLELILWPGVQWKGVMMSELLDPKKCKITYMKAIAKVHPDKLPANSTVEQRMLASGIFTTLNQAWDVFRTENNL